MSAKPIKVAKKRTTRRKMPDGKVVRLASAKALRSVTGKAGKKFAFRTKRGNVALVSYGRKNKAKTFRKTVTVQYRDRDGKAYRLTDTRIRKRTRVKRKRG
ncbi:MAG: hypothetical protein E6R08_02895 [Nevskiaceae bacterium]|nr:MAG: hypothetical protein E6R08_02895 [Nevskiaceae bacterium]